MVSVHKIEFTTDGETPKTLKEKLSKLVDEAFESEKDEEKRLNLFITALSNVAKSVVNSKDFDKKADKWSDYMTKKSKRDKISFFLCYEKTLDETIDDIIGLICDHEEITRDNDEK